MRFQARQSAGAAVDHGGDIAQAKALFPHAPEPWIDLSTGINPHSYPHFDLPATAFARLPEPARARELRAAAAKAYGASPRNVTAAPGTQMLLPRIASLVRPGTALVLGPTYAEHVRAAAMAGHKVSEVGEFEALAEADLAVAVNPNNPDGRIIDRARLLELAAAMRRRGGLLVVDEAYMDIGPTGASLAGDAAGGGLVVLRSFGKFFGLAGLRLGFAIASEEIADRLEADLGPWAVSGPALEYGLRALADWTWQDGMRHMLVGEAARLDALFARHGVPVAGGTSLFRFIRMLDAGSLFSVLAERGILVRRFAERSDCLRAGLPGKPEEWERLEEALAGWARGAAVEGRIRS
jgi:cobalamin biosynthetic protein CobC